MANTYDVGDLIRVSAAFTSAGAAIDPTAVTAKVKSPAGLTTTLVYGVDAGLIKDSVGNYHVDVSATEAGTYVYRFAATGTAQSASESFFRVRASAF